MNITLEASARPTSVWAPSESRSRRGRYVNATQVTLGAIEATERSQAAAKARLAERVTETLNNLRAPTFISAEGWVAVVYCYPVAGEMQYSYSLIAPGGTVGSCSSTNTWDDAVSAARHHLAQNVCVYTDDESVRRCAALLPDNHESRGRVEFLRYCAWQRAAAWAQAEGVDDVHSYACEHRNEFEVKLA